VRGGRYEPGDDGDGPPAVRARIFGPDQYIDVMRRAFTTTPRAKTTRPD